MPVDPQLLVAFVLTTAVAMLVPGPDMLFILGCGIRNGPTAGLLATCGVALSEMIHVTLAAAGLTALFAPFLPPSRWCGSSALPTCSTWAFRRSARAVAPIWRRLRAA